MRLRAALDATVGRRLLVRIWFHGFLLFAGVMITIILARYALPGHDAALAAHNHPRFALGVIERALAARGDPAALASEIAAIRDELTIDVTVHGAGGAVLGSGRDVLPVSVDERRALTRSPGYLISRDGAGDRFVVGAFGGALDAVAVARVPAVKLFPLHAFGMLASALLVALVLVAFPLSRSIARPLEQLGAAARALGAGRLSVRAPTDRHDEIGDLARAFNRMAEQIQRLRLAERELLGDVSHELRTPLARMRVVLDLASDADAERTRRYVREIATDLSELEQLIDDIIASSRLDPDAPHWAEARPPLRRRQVTTRELVDATALRFGERWPQRTLTCRGSSDELTVDGDPIWLRRALDNLVDNARKYSPDHAAIAIEVTEVEGGSGPGGPGVPGVGSGVRIEVIDHGVGISPDDWPRVFTPFFRADRSRARATGGVGLGLVLTRRIVEAHGGAIGFHSEPDAGSRFWLVLPRLATATRS